MNNTEPTTLDLHGLTRPAALHRLVEFLEQQQQRHKQEIVHIVTGMGQHSNYNGGPVLRKAVQKHLQDRNFKFTYHRGSFQVWVHSGCLTYHRQESAQDTKVVLVDQLLPSVQKLPTAPHSDLSSSSSLLLHGPALQEVVQDEKMLQKCKEASLETHRMEQKRINRERKDLQRALELSEHDDNDDELLLQRAIELSKEQENSERQEDERLLEQALALSLQQDTNVDDELLRALELSMAEHSSL